MNAWYVITNFYITNYNINYNYSVAVQIVHFSYICDDISHPEMLTHSANALPFHETAKMAVRVSVFWVLFIY